MARTTKRQAQVPQGPIEIHDDPLSWARSYQVPILHAFFILGKRFVVQVHNRKTGKDYLWGMIAKMFMMHEYGERGKSPLVIHAFPDFKTARETIWDGPCDSGRFIDVVFPPAIREEFSETECMIRLKDGYGTRTGPVYQLQGSKERMQSRRGPNATGVVLSEYQDHAETVYEEIYEPMVAANRGWAAFIGTPRGKNHLHTKFQYARQEMGKAGSPWYASFATCRETRRDAPGEDGSYVVSLEQITAMRARGVEEAIIQQEHFASFDGYLRGTIFGDVIRQAREDGRIARVVRDVNLPVGVCFDIGRSDGTAACFYQAAGREIRWIDYAFAQGQDAAYWVHLLKERKPYVYGKILLPWDATAKTFTAVKSTEQYFREMFRCPIVIAPKLPVQTGIEMVRRQFPMFVFDEAACTRPPDGQNSKIPSLLEALGNYHRTWSDERQDYSGEPVHDIHSHGADAMRTGGVGGLTPLEFPGETERAAPRAPAKTAFAPLGPFAHAGSGSRAGSLV